MSSAVLNQYGNLIIIIDAENCGSMTISIRNPFVCTGCALMLLFQACNLHSEMPPSVCVVFGLLTGCCIWCDTTSSIDPMEAKRIGQKVRMLSNSTWAPHWENIYRFKCMRKRDAGRANFPGSDDVVRGWWLRFRCTLAHAVTEGY